MNAVLRNALATGVLAMTVGAAAAQQTGEAFTNPGRFMLQDGGALYRDICQGCHMARGEGAKGAGAYPALARDANLSQAGYPVTVVLKGQKAMPPFAGMLSDAQVAAVVNFVRTNFGNAYADAVTAADVKAARP